MTIDYPDWMADGQQVLSAYFGLSTQIAALIATGQANGTPGGVPLLAAPIQLYSAQPFSVPAATAGFVVNNSQGAQVQAMAAYLSYEISLQCKALSAVTSTFMTFQLAWYGDAGATILLYRETWTVPCTSSGSVIAIGTGPVRGAFLKVTVTNEDPSQVQQVTSFVLFGNARPAPEPTSDWRTIQAGAAAVPQFIMSQAGSSSDDIIGVFSLTIPANSVTKLLCNLYNGFDFVTLMFTGGSTNYTYFPQTFISGTGLTQIGAPVTHTAPATDQQNWATPRSPLVVHVFNADVANTLTMNVIALAQHQG